LAEESYFEVRKSVECARGGYCSKTLLIVTLAMKIKEDISWVHLQMVFFVQKLLNMSKRSEIKMED